MQLLAGEPERRAEQTAHGKKAMPPTAPSASGGSHRALAQTPAKKQTTKMTAGITRGRGLPAGADRADCVNQRIGQLGGGAGGFVGLMVLLWRPKAAASLPRASWCAVTRVYRCVESRCLCPSSS